MKNILLCGSVLVLLSGCGKAAVDTAAVAPAADGTVYTAAVEHPERLPADRERDAARHPADVLEFLGVAPGMKVLDMFSGGGYYTEILARVVGANGQVVAHSNQAYESFAGKETTERYADGRLDNVDRLMAENNELSLPADEFDVIMMVLSYHDIYFVDADSGWTRINGPQLLAELYKSARPGAIFGIVDHYAAPGSPRETGGTTHRIDPAIVIGEVEAAGFRLEGRSDLLRNLDDDYSRNVFEPDLRGNTDRFVLKFKKPG